MLFTTWPFAGFLVVVLVLFFLLPRPHRRYLLLAASLLFYMAWKARFVFLILALIAIDYTAARVIHAQSGRRRRVALLVSLAANFGLLGWFKYANLFRQTWSQLFYPGVAIDPLHIILPLGISFHTFQSVSYVVDVYRGEQEVVTSFLDYALFVSFFPQLVAGPIVRAREFFGDLWNLRNPTGTEWLRGIDMILTGLAKKLVFADQFAFISDRYFNNPAALPGFVPAWSAAIAFALQIFFDFSGYSDIAIGVALLFGFHFPPNFRRPYFSASIAEFWRRWHMTLSRWLRDYLYIPLGGNRRGSLRTYFNLMITMLLGGLWHGASWTFVAWGGYHGALLALERLLRGRRQPTGPVRVPLAILTFLLVTLGWVLFRAGTMERAALIFGQMFSRSSGEMIWTAWQLRLALLALLLGLAEEHGNALTRLGEAPAWIRAAAAVLVLLAIEWFTASESAIPFVYFQF
ncbi:MAG: MBOAT family O-acyltransferase [Candidatus Sulfopaludibacter sp.]|nr:MBOAT family O-acyltransferase [Candidatus Sulfopaludibacter sp.]